MVAPQRLPFTDTSVQGGFTYAYKLRAADGCAEGPLSTCVTANATGPCSLVPTFDATTTTVANDGASAICDADLSWSPGASNCPLAAGVTYNVYRSTQHTFVRTVQPHAVGVADALRARR